MVQETKILLERSTDLSLRDRLDELGACEDTTGFTHAELEDRVYQKVKKRHCASLGVDLVEGNSSFVTPNAAVTADVENFGRENRLSGARTQEIYRNGFSTLWVTGNIIAPRVEVFPIDVTLLQLCVGFTFTQHFKMKNCTPLRTKFSWGDLQNFANLAVAKLTAEYFLDKGEEITVEVKLNAMSSGDFGPLALPYCLDGEQVGVVRISGTAVAPYLQLFLWQDGKPKEIDTVNGVAFPDSMRLLQESVLTLCLRNPHSEPLGFRAWLQNYGIHSHAEVEKDTIMRRRSSFTNLLGMNERSQAQVLGMDIFPNKGVVPYGEDFVITLKTTASVCGLFMDLMCIEVSNSTVSRFPVLCRIFESPIQFMNSIITSVEPPVLRFNKTTYGSAVESRQISVRNLLPHAIVTEWITVLLDQRKDSRYGAVVEFDRWSSTKNHVLFVGFPDVEGRPDSSIFKVEPQKMEIRPHQIGNLTVTFDPSSLNLPQLIEGKLVGHARLSDLFPKNEGSSWLNGSYAPSISMALRAEMFEPRLQIEALSEGLSFHLTAGEILFGVSENGFAVASNELRLVNNESTSIRFWIRAPEPFVVKSLRRRKVPTMKNPEKYSLVEENKDGSCALFPRDIATVEVLFRLNGSEFSAILDDQNVGNSCINIDGRLEVSHPGTENTQLIPLHGTIVMPRLECSKTELNFHSCCINKEYQLEFHIYNYSLSKCPWRVVCETSSPNFAVTPSAGMIHFKHESSLNAQAAQILVTFSPKSCIAYDATLLCYGFMDTLIAQIRLTGKGVVDYGRAHTNSSLLP